MNVKNTIILTLSTLSSFAIGFSVGYSISKNKFQALADKEIDDVKKLYENYFKNKKNDNENPDESTIEEKKEYVDYASRYTGNSDNEVSTDILKPKGTRSKSTKKPPYVIDGLQFGELEGYTVVTLYYYKDGVLADENDNKYENPEELLGKDALTSFGEEDATYVRDEVHKIDYEILLSEKLYSEIRDTTSENN